MALAPDHPSYPELGHVYPGDYCDPALYAGYVSAEQALPEGARVFDVRDYGAVPDPAVLSTEGIRRACEACRDAGGGVVLVSGGRYRSGTVRLYSHTTLFVAADSELRASRNCDDLIIRPEGTQDFGEESSGGAFILAVDAEDVTLTGGGVIHGEGEWFVHEPRRKPSFTPVDPVLLPAREEAAQINTLPGSIRTAYRERIRYAEDKYGEGKPVLRRPSALVWLLRCQGLRVENLYLRDSMCWTLHPEASDEIHIENVVIDDNRHVANTDGIDLSGCRDVTVRNCFISCADDGLCVKNPVYTHRESRNIDIAGCTVLTVMNAFKIGTGTRHDIRHVRIRDCDFRLTDICPGSVSGISIESCDGAVVEDILARDIRMAGIQCPLYILLNRRNQAGEPYDESVGSLYWGGHVRRVTIENVTAEGADLPCLMTGYADATRAGAPVRRAIEDITLRNLRLRYREAGEVLRLPETVPELLTDYPECNAHGDLPACGLNIRHADRVTLDQISVSPRSCNTRPVLFTEDVTGLRGEAYPEPTSPSAEVAP
ncbi:MAG: hypothetical protein IKP40_06630 [Clostridia bacterium]|nr:hypothetical protein [Clostridia bacterium]